MFEALTMARPDPILGKMAAFRADPRPGKVDLGVGVYRDAAGRTPVFAAVKTAEHRLWATQADKAYLGLLGDVGFNAAMIRLTLGPAVDAVRTAGCQAAGGSGALRILGDLVARANPAATVWLPDPSWPNHGALVGAAGLRWRTYPYYDAEAGRADAPALVAALADAAAGDVVLLHGCCHNPTGADLGVEVWRELGGLMAERGLVPLVDLAYQGFGRGLEEDAEGLRTLAGLVPEMMLAASCSKNFGMYRDRVGAAIVVASDAGRAAVVESQLAQVVRAGHSMPPDHGAAVVRLVLETPELAADWRGELGGMRERLAMLRHRFADALEARTNRPVAPGLRDQAGLFSRLRLAPEAIAALEAEHAIYLVGDGRINVAGLGEATVDRVAEAIATVLRG